MKKKIASVMFSLEIPLGVCAGMSLDKGHAIKTALFIGAQMVVTYIACSLWPTPKV